jgi:universal stress protein E
MNKLTRILVALDGTNADAIVTAKGVALARQQGAALELFLCDAQRAYALQHAYDQSAVEDSRHQYMRTWRRYLESLRDTMAGVDVPIYVDVACESPLYEGIVRKALKSRCDLVIKNAGSSHPTRRFVSDANDWQLMRSCPATLLLSRGRMWQPYPKLAAAVDVSDRETSELPEAILQTAAVLSMGSQGDFDVLYSEPGDVEPREHERHVAILNELLLATTPRGAASHLLAGNAEDTLPAFAAAYGYDAWVMGALTHREGLSALVGTLTARLVESLDCDFVLVKPSTYTSQIELIPPQAIVQRRSDRRGATQ